MSKNNTHKNNLDQHGQISFLLYCILTQFQTVYNRFPNSMSQVILLLSDLPSFITIIQCMHQTCVSLMLVVADAERVVHLCALSPQLLLQWSQANTIEFTVVLSTYPNPFFSPQKNWKSSAQSNRHKTMSHQLWHISIIIIKKSQSDTTAFFSVALTDGSALFHFAAAPQSMLFNDFVTLQ